jgi:hypothetical protein
MSNKPIGRTQRGLLEMIIEWIIRLPEFILSIFRPGPRIDGFTPVQGYPGTVLEIDGAKFSATRADNHVMVGGKDALVLEASPTRLKVIATVGTETGPVRVRVGNLTGVGPYNFEVLKYPAADSEEDGPPILHMGAGKGQAGGLPSTGTIRLLVMPVHPSDRVPANPANARQAIINEFNHARTFYLQASYNTLTLGTSATNANITVGNWHQLSGNYSEYVRLNARPGKEKDDWWVPNVIPGAMERLHAETAWAAEDQGHDLDDFDMMAVVIFGNGQLLRAWGDMKKSSFSYDNVAQNLHINIPVGHDVYLVDLAETANWGRIAHEIAHNIVDGGIKQAALTQPEDVYLSGLIDPKVATAEEFELMGDHDEHPLFSGFFMRQLKWYSNANIVELAWDRNPFPPPGQPAAEYDIVAHGLTQNTNPNRYHLVRIKITQGLSYYVEVRQRPDPTAATPQVFDENFDKNIVPAGAANYGGAVVTAALSDVINMNQEMRLITLLHDSRVLKTGDVVTDPLRSIKISVVNDNVVARPQVCRVRVEWAQTISDDPKGQFDLWVTKWDSNYQSDDIWVDRNPWGTYDHADTAGNPVDNGDKPRPNEINHFWGRVHNSGQIDATNVRLAFYAVEPPGVGDNGNWTPLPGSPKIISVKKNDSAKDFINWTPVVGKHTCLKIVAEQQLGEVSGGNNSAQENVSDFEAAASSVPNPVIITVAVRNPLKERTVALISVRGVPEGFVAQFPHAWVWLDQRQERLFDLTVVPVCDVDYYHKQEIPRANVVVDGWIPHSYRRQMPSGDYPGSVMLPMGGITARVTPKYRSEITLEEDQDYNRPEAVGLRGEINPPIGNQPVRVDLTDPKGRLRVQQVFTNAGHFRAVFDLTRAPSEDPLGREPGEGERPISGDYRAQAFIINAPRVAEAESNVVHLKK